MFPGNITAIVQNYYLAFMCISAQKCHDVAR